MFDLWFMVRGKFVFMPPPFSMRGDHIASSISIRPHIFWSSNILTINPFKPNGISHSYMYQLYLSIFVLMVFDWYFLHFN